MSMFLQLLMFSSLLGWSLLAVLAVLRVRGRKVRADGSLPPVTILKPLSGTEPGLEDALRSVFELDYPRFELVFGVQDRGDAALAVVERLLARYPQVACRVVVDERRGLNPKVSNLRAMLGVAQHDWLVVSDSNVCVNCCWLRELAALAIEPGVGLSFNLVTAQGQGTLAGELESLQLGTFIASGCAIPTELFDHPAVIGKSMMFRRSLLEALGGLESVESLLAEDYVMGQMFAAAGYRVCIAPTPVAQVRSALTLREFVQRHLRWAMLRCRLQPTAYLLEPLFGPLPLGLLGVLLGHQVSILLPLAGVIVALRDLTLLALLTAPASGEAFAKKSFFLRALFALVVGPSRELLMLAVWAMAPFASHVRWRGHRLRLAAGTRLYVEAPLRLPA